MKEGEVIFMQKCLNMDYIPRQNSGQQVFSNLLELLREIHQQINYKSAKRKYFKLTSLPRGSTRVKRGRISFVLKRLGEFYHSILFAQIIKKFYFFFEFLLLRLHFDCFIIKLKQ